MSLTKWVTIFWWTTGSPLMIVHLYLTPPGQWKITRTVENFTASSFRAARHAERVSQATMRISFNDISFCVYHLFFKISLKYCYRIFLTISHDIYLKVPISD